MTWTSSYAGSWKTISTSRNESKERPDALNVRNDRRTVRRIDLTTVTAQPSPASRTSCSVWLAMPPDGGGSGPTSVIARGGAQSGAATERCMVSPNRSRMAVWTFVNNSDEPCAPAGGRPVPRRKSRQPNSESSARASRSGGECAANPVSWRSAHEPRCSRRPACRSIGEQDDWPANDGFSSSRPFAASVLAASSRRARIGWLTVCAPMSIPEFARLRS